MDNQTDTIRRQSGVLPVFGGNVVLVTTRRSGRWIIPKGHVEKGMSAADSAAKEAFEEAGVTGCVSSGPIGSYTYRRQSGLFMVEVFPFEVDTLLDEWHEMAVRRRSVVTPSEASRMVFPEELGALIAAFFLAV